ncbi:Crp/Fnr family transcriptional regulator [Geothrix sp. 21YS21S-4]|uniref:Crp/Fnr family transcriptional regulator n=1 Tax=Geothrix sp. 21YS21S-4 TaxID=3068889 RepID=UPI0027BAD292|nr:cyclic nucleotide-binding domain-containing protein [Geothrix sp. 21YS21S-4]
MPVPMTLDQIRSFALAEIKALTLVHPEIRPLLYREGEWLFQESDASNKVFIVLRGTYAVEKEASGLVLDEVTCDAGHFAIVGEMAYLGGQSRTASVRARTECHVLVLVPAHLETVMERFPMLTRVICRQFALRLKAANETIQELRADLAYHGHGVERPVVRDAKAHLIVPGSWNQKVGRKGTTLCGLRIPSSESLLNTGERVDYCPECEEALARGEHWGKV